MTASNILYTVILYPLVQIIEISFKIFDKLFDNTGIAVLGVSFTVTILCLPLYIVAEHWQQIERNTQKKLKSGVERIKQTFKGDEQYMILSTFYRQNHYHPIMALRSSFGLLIQIPFFMAAYSCLSKLPALQGKSFLFIRDLGQQDALFHIINFPVNVLPIAMTVINIIAGAVYTKGFAFREKLQIYGMALIFLAVLYTSPSGLVLYWTMNNIFSLVKNIFYKLKNPLKVLYILMLSGCIFITVYILFIYDGGASLKKRIAAIIPILLLTALPFYLKILQWFLNKPLSYLINNKNSRTKLFLFSAIGLTVLSGLVLPGNLIISSVLEFSNIENYKSPVDFLSAPLLQSIGFFFFWPVCIYFLFGNKIQTLIAAFFSFLLVTSSVNAFIFSGNYGSMDITLKFIGGIQPQTKQIIIANLFTIVLLFFIIHALLSKKTLDSFISFMFVITSVYTVLGIINTVKINSEYKKNEIIRLTDKSSKNEDFSKIIHLSKTEKNVLLFMLDRAESSYFPYIIENFSKLKKDFSGFVYYPNTVSPNGHTLMGSPCLYGGYEYLPSEINKRKDEKLLDKHNEALLVLPRIFTEEADFYATVCDLSWGNYNYNSDLSFINNYSKITPLILRGRYSGEFKKTIDISKKTSLVKNANRNLFFVSLFRVLPVILRPVIYYKGSWWSSEQAEDTDNFIDQFSTLCYLNKITDFTSSKGSLLVLTNESTHSNESVPYLNITKDIKHFDSDLPGYDINVASLDKLAEFCLFLKENDVYDNTRIIIVADHGIGYGATASKNYNTPVLPDGSNKDHYNPLLLVKDFNASGDLKSDMTFMTNADTPAIAVKDLIKEPVNPFSGNIISSKAKKDGILITTDDMFMPHHSKSKYIFTAKQGSWYRVKDNMFDDSNWIPEEPEN